VTDFRSGEERIVPVRRGPSPWPLWVIMAIAALGAVAWIAAPAWLGQASEKAAPPASDTKFADLYKRYGTAPLAADVAGTPAVDMELATLQKEPCNRRLVYKASVALENAHVTRAAAEMLKGFSDACPDANNELYRASELYFLIGDYDAAIRWSGDVIRRQPDAQNAYYVRGRAEQGLKKYAAAVDDYVTLIQLMPNLKNVRSEVFTRLSESYENLNLPCEAIMPLQTYMALDPAQRTTRPLERRVLELATKGSCGAGYAQGTARIARRSAGVPIARAEVNGVAGTFLLDTGASFVTLSPAFAAKAKPTPIGMNQIELQSANGVVKAILSTAAVVKLAGLSATAVPTLVSDRGFGDNVDGLLGMSFLSRFTILIEDGQMKLTAKALKIED
jgi:clan AA aspartic protease (TIGR02281 family)